jgi:uncharacterized protein YndB with AHSA1/START domain
MATNSITIDAPVERVFSVLADGRRYAEWVVGAKRIRSVDESWPEPGSKFHHTIGVGPIELDDNSEVLDVEPNRRLKLRVRARPAGQAEVTLTLHPTDGMRTRVDMEEHPVRGFAKLIHNPLLDASLKGRNAEALRRLKNRVEAGHA